MPNQAMKAIRAPSRVPEGGVRRATLRRIGFALSVGVLIVIAATSYFAITAKGGSDEWKTRARAQIVQVTALPSDVVWKRLVDTGAAVFVVGDRGSKAIVGQLDAQLRLVAVLELSGACQVLEAQPAGARAAIIACWSDNRVSWKALSADAGEMKQADTAGADLIVGDLASYRREPRVRAASQEGRHFWLIEQFPERWALGRGSGVAAPLFERSLAEVVAAFAPCTVAEVALASTRQEGEIVLSVVGLDRPIINQTVVAGAVGRYPRVVCAGDQISVYWVKEQPKSFNPFSSRFRHVQSRRYDLSLRPRGEVQRVSVDDHVMPLNDYRIRSGAVLVWNQGIREPWDAVTALSVPEAGRTPLRLPGPDLPLSIIQHGEAMAFLSATTASSPRRQEVIGLAPFEPTSRQ